MESLLTARLILDSNASTSYTNEFRLYDFGEEENDKEMSMDLQTTLITWQ